MDIHLIRRAYFQAAAFTERPILKDYSLADLLFSEVTAATGVRNSLQPLS